VLCVNLVQFPLFSNRGDRKERFVAEIRLRKLVGGFLREQADPHIEKGSARLQQIESLVTNLQVEDSRKEGYSKA
jgi:hypothetical protein